VFSINTRVTAHFSLSLVPLPGKGLFFFQTSNLLSMPAPLSTVKLRGRLVIAPPLFFFWIPFFDLELMPAGGGLCVSKCVVPPRYFLGRPLPTLGPPNESLFAPPPQSAANFSLLISDFYAFSLFALTSLSPSLRLWLLPLNLCHPLPLRLCDTGEVFICRKAPFPDFSPLSNSNIVMSPFLTDVLTIRVLPSNPLYSPQILVFSRHRTVRMAFFFFFFISMAFLMFVFFPQEICRPIADLAGVSSFSF